jgi:high-affinity nickel-transport protein
MSGIELPADVLGLAAVALLLGLRHGLDPDHLAAIDGIAWHNAASRPRLARLCGAWFSLGHGVVVVAVALALSLVAGAWRMPVWLDAVGAWTSIAVLALLALANVAAVLRTPLDRVARVAGWRSTAFAGALRVERAPAVMGVGALFALSFDVFGQAALFAVAAARHGGWPSTLLLGLLFTGGMAVTDGLNGWWVSRLSVGGGHTARVASRVFALAVAGVGLGTAALMLTARLVPAAGAWVEGRGPWLGAAVVVLLAAACVAARRAPARPARDVGRDPSTGQARTGSLRC